MSDSTIQVLLPCAELAETIDFFLETLGFQVESIWPADDPRVAVLVGHGTHLRLDVNHQGDPGVLVLEDREVASSDVSTDVVAPNGTRILVESPTATLPELRQKLTITRLADQPWGTGRAAMKYRDLIPEREGGRFIASHIHIPDGGPVPDYVHHHDIRFQIIFVRSGWVKVVYEDQGPPFIMEAGDCVLQPPHIRHRVLESSADLEVIEIGSPAEHRTSADLVMELPTPEVRPGRDFGGQRFVRHVAEGASWKPSRLEGFESRNCDIDAATSGLADVRVHRVRTGEPVSGEKVPTPEFHQHGGEFQFFFVLAGSVALEFTDRVEGLTAADAVTIPADQPFRFTESSDDLSLLEVRLPAEAPA